MRLHRFCLRDLGYAECEGHQEAGEQDPVRGAEEGLRHDRRGVFGLPGRCAAIGKEWCPLISRHGNSGLVYLVKGITREREREREKDGRANRRTDRQTETRFDTCVPA